MSPLPPRAARALARISPKYSEEEFRQDLDRLKWLHRGRRRR